MEEQRREDEGGGGEGDRPVRSQATDGEKPGRESIRQAEGVAEGGRPATVTAHVTKKHRGEWKLTRLHSH